MFKMIWFRFHGFGDDPIESHSFGSNGDDHLGTHCGWTMSALGCWCRISGATKTAVKSGEKLFSALDTTFVFYNHPHSGILRIHGIFPQGKMAAKIGGTSSQGPTSQVPSASQSERARLVFCTLGASWSHEGGLWWKIWLKNDLNSPKSRWSHGMTNLGVWRISEILGVGVLRWSNQIQSKF